MSFAEWVSFFGDDAMRLRWDASGGFGVCSLGDDRADGTADVPASLRCQKQRFAGFAGAEWVLAQALWALGGFLQPIFPHL